MLVTLVIIFSKAVGFLREMVVAHYFGTQPENDAYVAAYALFYIPVLLLNSCITSTLVPCTPRRAPARGLRAPTALPAIPSTYWRWRPWR